jgi:hypothetical protein
MSYYVEVMVLGYWDIDTHIHVELCALVENMVKKNHSRLSIAVLLTIMIFSH